MVMATGSVCQQYGAGDLAHEAAGAEGAEAEDDGALHERLVAYVHALAPPHESRSGVWVEHSYARARGAAHAPASHVRVLLAPAAAALAEPDVDVERLEPAPLPPGDDRRAPELEPELESEPEPGDDADWEPRVAALAPSAAHAALADSALDALRRLRLACLAGGRAAEQEHVRIAARRLRYALTQALGTRGPPATRPGPWLHATLQARAPRAVRRLYDAVAAELHRAAPRLAGRALGGLGAAAGAGERAGAGAGERAGAGALLVWVCSGEQRTDARWRRRLGALLPTRALAAAAPEPGRPDAWCAAVAGATRAALADMLAEAGSSAVILGGAGPGATLCAALAGAAPAGTGPAPGGTGPAPATVRGVLMLAPPLLTAEGSRDAPDDPLAELRVPALVVAGSGAAAAWRSAAGPARRVLEVRGADDALRATRALRLRRRLPQRALDAAIADECARWALETAEGALATPPRSPPRARRRAADDEEYAHLPDAAPGRVVSRGSGCTPLALLPPRRPPAAAPALAAADIMRLPIVFADDAGVGAVTVTSGRGGARPLLLRRAVRVLPRAAPR